MNAVTQAIDDALARHLRSQATSAKPKRMFLGEHAANLLHMEAATHGVVAPLFPHYEEERLEFRGMKVHVTRSSSITFE